MCCLSRRGFALKCICFVSFSKNLRIQFWGPVTGSNMAQGYEKRSSADTAMAEKQTTAMCTAQQRKCEECKSSTDYMLECKECNIEFCTKCARPEMHGCGSMATWMRHRQATTTSKASSLAIDAQIKGKANGPQATSKPLYPRKPIYVIHVGKD